MRCTSRSWAERRSPCMTARLRSAARAALAPLALPPSPSGGTPPPALAAAGWQPSNLRTADRNLVPVKLSPTKESIVSVTGPGATSPRRRDVGDVSVTLTFTGVMGLVGPRLNASVEPAGTNGRQKRMENRPYLTCQPARTSRLRQIPPADPSLLRPTAWRPSGTCRRWRVARQSVAWSRGA